MPWNARWLHFKVPSRLLGAHATLDPVEPLFCPRRAAEGPRWGGSMSSEREMEVWSMFHALTF